MTESTRPRCWNREPQDPIRVRHGIDQATGERIEVVLNDAWGSPGCKTWSGTDIGPPTAEWPSGQPYPVAHGFAEWCQSCRWMPAEFA